MVLTKIIINSPESKKFADFEIQKYLDSNNTFQGLIILDIFNRLHFTESIKFIPQNFNNKLVFISGDSFQQNHKILAKNIRQFVSSVIDHLQINNLICIGGESYLYGLTNNINYIYHFTNSRNIYNDCQFNIKFYNSIIQNNLIDYNKIKKINNSSNNVLINLSMLNYNLLKIINNYNFNNIIIINCNNEDFWKKIKLLSNYKIKFRKQFICYKLKYFITVTMFVKK